MNPQQQITYLTQKLQASQAQFEKYDCGVIHSYKIQCKQLESFLEEESAHKQAEIRQLKQEAIKREKIITSLKNQLSLAQSDNKNLKSTISQLQTKLSSLPVSAASLVSNPNPPPPQIQPSSAISQQNYDKAIAKVSELYKQIESMEYKMSNDSNKSKIVIEELHSQNEHLQHRISSLTTQIEQLKKQSTVQQSQQQTQAMKQQQQQFNNANNGKLPVPGTAFRTVEIKIQKTKEISAPLSSRSKDSKGSDYHYKHDQLNQEVGRLKGILRQKDDKIEQLNQKIGKILDKVIKYERRIKQLEHMVSSGHQRSYDEEAEQVRYTPTNHKQQQKPKQELLNQQKSPKTYKQSYDQPQNQHVSQNNQVNQHILTSLKPTISHALRPTTSVLILTKKYYTSPFLDLPPNTNKNTLRLYKTDKNGKIDRTMGSILYKVDNISYNIDQIVVLAIESINKNMRNNNRSRIVVYGVRKSYKKVIMVEIVNRIRNLLQHIVQQLTMDQGETQKLNGSNTGTNVSVCYLELEDQFVKNVQMAGNTQEEIVDILDFIAGLSEEQPKTPKKQQKGEFFGTNSNNNQKKVRYFSFDCGVRSIEIITSDFLDPNIKQQQGLDAALDKIAYSKIPIIMSSNIEQQEHSGSWQTHAILTLNPIVNLYDQCKSTLALSNFKKGPARNYMNSMSMTMRNGSSEQRQQYCYQSPPRMENNSSVNLYKSNILAEKEQETGLEQNVRISRMQQKIQFYRIKLNQLLVQLKVILNANNGNISYLKKSQNILNYEKIQRFVQSIINQGQQTEYFSPSKKSYFLANLEQLSISP